MADKGTRITDDAVRRAERAMSRTYRQAQKEIDDKLKAWQKGHAAREAQLRQRVKDGKMSQADFDAWMRGQVFQGKQWEAKRQQIRDTLLHADQEAMRIVRDGKVGVFTDNANFMGQRIADKAHVSASFNMYDEHTVARLLTKDPMLLPKLPPEKAIKKDKAYGYYNRLVSSAITQGIIQGESVQKIARRITETACNGCYSSAVRTARTAYTCAQNAGRVEGMRQARTLGVDVQKKWLAAHDGHTRDAHVHLDGQVRDVEEPFESDLGEIMYPGDPYAAPANVYNCRCTLIEVFPEYQHSSSAIQTDIDLAGMDSERAAIINDTYERLNQEYPLRNAPLNSIQSFRVAHGLPADYDYWDFTDEHTDWNGVGGIYFPSTTKQPDGPSLEGPHITIYGIEDYGTEAIRQTLSVFADIRERDGWHSKGDSFWNVGVGVEGGFMHEYGHALSEDCGMYWGGPHYAELEAIYKKYTKEEIGRDISIYASTNAQEMFAEAFVLSLEPRLSTPMSEEIMSLFHQLRGDE